MSLSTADKAVMTMECCKAQLFTRGPLSDRIVRDSIRPEEPAPAAVQPVADQQVATVREAIAEKPHVPARAGFGLFAGLMK